MSDTVDKVPTVESSSTSAEASISVEKTEPTTEKKKWGDVEDDDEDEAVSELISLSIKEEEKRDSVLEEPEDSNIKAVFTSIPFLFFLLSVSRFSEL